MPDRHITKTVKAARAFYVFDNANTAAVNFERAHQWLAAHAYHPPGEKYFVVSITDDRTKEHKGYLI